MNTNDELKNETANDTKPVLGEGACMHKNREDIGYYFTVDGRLYDGWCNDCQRKIYARTGRKVIYWNADRSGTFA